MSLSLIHQPAAAASASPYRLLDRQGHEIAWANAFLDAQRVRQLALRSLRAYAYDLLHFARWLDEAPQPLSEITESTLLDYVRHQLDREPKPSPPTVNHRLGVVRCWYRFHFGRAIPAGQSHFQRTYTKRSPLGYGRPRRAVALGLRLRQPRRVMVPLSAEEVARFWRSFRTFRDLALVGLMLLDGLAPARCWLFRSRISNCPMPKCGSSAKETRSAFCRCPRKSSRSSKNICGWKGRSSPRPPCSFP